MRVFIVPKYMSKGIFHSQVLNIFNEYKGEKVFLFRNKKAADDLDATYLYLSKTELLKNRTKVDSVYSRNYRGFILAVFIMIICMKKIHITYDFRGIMNEEYSLWGTSKIRKKLIFYVEKMCFRLATEVRCVSYNMKDYLLKNFGERDIKVIPCCISKTAESTKENHDIINFLYLGSMAVWQNFEAAALFYKKINCNKSFTVITHDKQEAENILRELQIKAEVKSMPQFDITPYISKFDFGFILRTNTPTNTVASPVKFLEYCSNGVVPIATNFVGDYSCLFKDYIYIVQSLESIDIDFKKLLELKKSSNKNALIEKSKGFLWSNYSDLLQ